MAAGLTSVRYVLGVQHSGTTLLGNLLGNRPGYVSVGELRMAWRQWLNPDARCGCGELARACPFWREVSIERAAGDLGVEGAARVDARLAATRRLPALAAGRLEGEAAPLRAAYARLQQRVAAAAGAEVVVDTSKTRVDRAAARTIAVGGRPRHAPRPRQPRRARVAPAPRLPRVPGAHAHGDLVGLERVRRAPLRRRRPRALRGRHGRACRRARGASHDRRQPRQVQRRCGATGRGRALANATRSAGPRAGARPDGAAARPLRLPATSGFEQQRFGCSRPSERRPGARAPSAAPPLPPPAPTPWQARRGRPAGQRSPPPGRAHGRRCP